jgi:hypothetical protein
MQPAKLPLRHPQRHPAQYLHPFCAALAAVPGPYWTEAPRLQGPHCSPLLEPPTPSRAAPYVLVVEQPACSRKHGLQSEAVCAESLAHTRGFDALRCRALRNIRLATHHADSLATWYSMKLQQDASAPLAPLALAPAPQPPSAST